MLRRTGHLPITDRTGNLCGFAPSVADQCWSSNDSLLLNSNSVLHHSGSLLRHETARAQLETSARFAAHRPGPSRSRLHPYFPFSITPFSNIDSRSHTLAGPSSASVLSPRPPCQRLPSDGFFERAPPILCSAPLSSPRAHLRKSTNVTQEEFRPSASALHLRFHRIGMVR
jgi:hypothetical protein